MGKKRFTSQRTDDYNYSDILDNGKWLGICHVDCEDDFVDKLNELHEKKEILEVQLRSATNEIDKLMSEIDMLTDTCHDCCKEIREENKELKLQNEDLLYQIGYVGKNNKTCRECECFLPEIKYCYMWDMEVEADDVVVACDQRKVKNINEMISDD